MRTSTPARSAWTRAVLIAAMGGLGASPSPAQDATAAMQGPLATQVREGCNSELTKY
jgi:hypothetical protein